MLPTILRISSGIHSISDKALICGKVLRTTDSYAIIRIKNARKTKKIKIGSEAMPYVEKKVRISRSPQSTPLDT